MRSVSVVVCTRDRPAALAACLRSLADEPAAEVLVVDNGRASPVRVPDGPGPPVRVVVAPHPGLARARNLGLEEARSDVALFVDDDVTAHPGLVAAHAATYEPGVVAVGGPIRFLPTRPRPPWLDPSLEALLSVLEGLPAGTDLAAPALPYGANFSVDVAAARSAGGFDERLGRQGDGLASGEESDLLVRLVTAGGRVRWTPDGAVDHHIPSDRLRLRWFARRAWAQGQSDVRAGRLDQPEVSGLRLAWTALRPGGTPWPPSGPPTLGPRLAAEMVRRIRLLGAAVAHTRR